MKGGEPQDPNERLRQKWISRQEEAVSSTQTQPVRGLEAHTGLGEDAF